jgi:hypothetical protein
VAPGLVLALLAVYLLADSLFWRLQLRHRRVQAGRASRHPYAFLVRSGAVERRL